MGNKESKKRPHQHETKAITNACKNKTNTEIFIVEQKQHYEERYKKLEINYIKLQQQFLAMKAKFDQNIGETGDFTSHSIEVNNKLEEALHEKGIQNNNINNNPNNNNNINNINNDKSNNNVDGVNNVDDVNVDNGKEFQHVTDATGDGFINLTEYAYKEKIQYLEKELDKLLSDDIYKNQEIIELKAQLEEFQMKAAEEKASLIEEFNSKGLLLREKYEEETKQLKKIWEEKILETLDDCRNEITQFKNKHNKEKIEKFDLKEKLEKTESQLASLEKKHKSLTNMYEDIRQRYESRESRLEDLEKIADLEGQLIVHAEELEKQKDLIKSMKNSRGSNNSSGTGTGNRNKKNTKKHRKCTPPITEKC